MKTETIQWHVLPVDGLPDAMTTVLAETAVVVDAAFIDDNVWRWCETGGRIAEDVLAWAHLPKGIAC